MRKISLLFSGLIFLSFVHCGFVGQSAGLFNKPHSSKFSLSWLLGARALSSPGQIPGYNPSSPATSTTQYVVASEGGTLYLNNEVQLNIPPGSLSEDTTIEVRKLDAVPTGNTQGFTAFGQAYEFLPEGTTFDPANPATLTIHYDTGKMAAQSLDPNSLAVAYLDTSSNGYVGVPNHVDTSTGTIQAQLQHFTIYIPMAQNFAATSVTPPSILVTGTMPATAIAGAPVYVMARVTTPYAGSGGSIAKVRIKYTMVGDGNSSVWMDMPAVQVPNPTWAASYYENYYGLLIPASMWHTDPCADGMVSAVNPEIRVDIMAVDNAGRVTQSLNNPIEGNRVLRLGTSAIQSSGTGSVIAAGYSRTLRVNSSYTNGCGGAVGGPTQVVIDPASVQVSPVAGSSGSSGAVTYPVLGTIVLTPTVVPASGSNTLNVSVSMPEPIAPYNFNVIPGTVQSIQVLDTNGAVPTGPIVVNGRSTYAFDARGLDAYGNSIPIIPTGWTISDAGSGIAGGVVTVSNNPDIATVTASYDPFPAGVGSPLTATAQLNIIPRYTVSVNVTGLVGSTTLSLNGVSEAGPITSNGTYTLTGYVGNLTTPTVSTAAQPFMGACHGGSQFVSGSDVTINVQCYQLMGNSVVSATPPVLGNPVQQVTLAGYPGVGGSVDGFGNNARFNGPEEMTTDGKNLYLVDFYGHRVRKIEISTGEVTTVAGSGVAGYLDDVGTLARFNYPDGITTDGTYLYVSDHHTVKKIHLKSRQVTTIAGSPTAGAADNAAGFLARFNRPFQITTDGTSLFVSDMDNYAIRRIDIATGAVSTLAGNLGYSGYVDGSSAIARFSRPHGVTTDGTYLYVSDWDNARVRRVAISDGTTSTLITLGTPHGITYIAGQLYVVYSGNSASLYRYDLGMGIGQTIAASSIYYGHGLSSDGVGIFCSDWNAFIRHFY